jgi:hypothetical protein
MAINIDSLAAEIFTQYADSFLSAAYHTGATYQGQTGDNGPALQTLIMVLVGSIVWSEFRSFIQTRALGRDRANGRGEILSAIERVKVEGAGAVARIEQDNVGRDKQIGDIGAQLAFLKGKLEK